MAAIIHGSAILFTLYTTGAVLLTLYTLGEFHLLWYYLRRNHPGYGRPVARPYADDELPVVTVQIPMFNEMYVAEHVIDACARFDYPRDRFEIQVVDDSTDESVEIARSRVAHWRTQGVDISHVHRGERRGFKAGALADATPRARGEFIAIFDADFRPEPDFLRRALPYLRDERVGFVQTRWGHLNRDYSVFTRVQSVLLDMFYLIEQTGRAVAGFFIRFNGAGGIWRRRCIDDSGGWSSDTLAEDLDLCYRAQLRGWKGVYDESIVAKAEIPVTMSDFRAQQHRWTKGKVQVTRKLFGPIWRAPIPLMTKVHALADLLNVIAIPSVLALSLCSVPLLYVSVHQPVYARYLQYVSFGLVNVLVAPWFVFIVARAYASSIWEALRSFLRVLPPLIAVVVGMTVFQFAAMLDGVLGRKSFFHRTSKYNALRTGDTWRGTAYAPRRVSPTVYIEGVLPLYFAAALAMALTYQSFGAVPFHVVLICGYSYVCALSVMKA